MQLNASLAETRRHRPIVRGILRGTVQAVLRAAFRIEIRGYERWKQSPDALVVANHVSFIDGPLLSLLSPHAYTYAVTAEFARHPIWRRGLDLLSLLGAGSYVSVDPESPFGMRKILAALLRGEGAMVFPEGGISRTGQLAPLQPGAAIAAVRTSATVLPVRLVGLERSLFGRAPSSWRSPMPRITVEVGQPIESRGMTAQELQEAITRALSR